MHYLKLMNHKDNGYIPDPIFFFPSPYQFVINKVHQIQFSH